MNFGYVFDENFTLPAGVSIYSLLVNNKNIENINLYILDDGISFESKKILKKMVNAFHRRITFVDVKKVKDILSETTPYNWNGSYSTYIRLMLNTLFPDRDDTIIMIDADTIINGSMEHLLDEVDPQSVCSMALEAMPAIYHKYSGLGESELYNGGLIAVNLKRWREENAEDQIVNFLSNVRTKNMLTDEDVISTLFKGKISRISAKYNFLAQYYLYSSDWYYHFFGWDDLSEKGIFYPLNEMQSARENVVMYHCIDTFTNRPWFDNNIHPYKKLFEQYRAHTPWKNMKLPVRKMKPLTKAEYVFRKILPKNMSRLLYAVAVKLYYGIGAKKYYRSV